MASVEVLSATPAHVEETKHDQPMNNTEETAKKEEVSPPPPPPPPPPQSEEKQTEPTEPTTEPVEPKAPEPETLVVAMETKAVLIDEPTPKTKGAEVSTNEKTKETAKVAPIPEPVDNNEKDEEDKPVHDDEEKVATQAEFEKKED